MSSTYEIIIPNFINCHAFWITMKKDQLIHCAINRELQALYSAGSYETRSIVEVDPVNYLKYDMVAVLVDKFWARGIIDQVISEENDAKSHHFVCWLPDYGTQIYVKNIFPIPEQLKKCQHLARQASLNNVVNLTVDFNISDTPFELILEKTADDVQGVRTMAVDCIEKSDKIYFNECSRDEFNIYGDIICSDKNNKRESLTQCLIEKDLVCIDEEFFKSIDPSRKQFKDAFFKESQMWQKKLPEVNMPIIPIEYIFGVDVKTFPAMEFLRRNEINNVIFNNLTNYH